MMWSSDSETDLAAGAGTVADPAASITTTSSSSSSMSSSSSSSMSSSSSSSSSCSPQPRRRRYRQRRRRGGGDAEAVAVAEAEDVWRGAQWESAWPRRPKPVVLAEEAAAAPGGADAWGDAAGEAVGRARSLTDDDLEELKGCVDLGFGFNYDEIPELCGTLPALELCYSMSQRFLDEHHPHHQQPQTPPAATAPPSPSPPIANWKISSPGDSPDEVKARLKYWAQAVACTVRLCS